MTESWNTSFQPQAEAPPAPAPEPSPPPPVDPAPAPPTTPPAYDVYAESVLVERSLSDAIKAEDPEFSGRWITFARYLSRSLAEHGAEVVLKMEFAPPQPVAVEGAPLPGPIAP